MYHTPDRTLPPTPLQHLSRRTTAPLALPRAARLDIPMPAPAPGPWLEAALSAETRLMTPEGPRSAGLLQPGDRLLTLDHGALPVLWTGQRHVATAEIAACPALAPRNIPAGSLGPHAPRRALRLSPQAHVLLERPDLPAGGLLIPAASLAAPCPPQDVTFTQILLPRHALIGADGILVDTLHPARLPETSPLLAGIAAALPQIAHDVTLYGPESRTRADPAP